MSPADRIEMLRVLGVEVRLTDAGEVAADGPPLLVSIAEPVLQKHRDELIEHLGREGRKS